MKLTTSEAAFDMVSDMLRLRGYVTLLLGDGNPGQKKRVENVLMPKQSR